MIDLSCHVLEGTGCGPSSLEEAVEMCRLAKETGVHTIVATPCWKAGASAPPITLADCDHKLDLLREHAGKRLTIEFGFSFDYSADLPSLTDTFGPEVALGRGWHLLISLPATALPKDVEKTWEELRRRGYSIVLARPECSPALRSHRERLDEWVRWGAKVQLAAASITGGHGRTVKHFAAGCLNAYSESVVLATRARSARPTDFILAAAKGEAAKTIGASRASAAVGEIPLTIINGESKRRDVSKTRPSAGQTSSSVSAIRSALSFLKQSA